MPTSANPTAYDSTEPTENSTAKPTTPTTNLTPSPNRTNYTYSNKEPCGLNIHYVLIYFSYTFVCIVKFVIIWFCFCFYDLIYFLDLLCLLTPFS